MLGRVVFGSRTWIWTMAAPALAASIADWAICCGVTGTAELRPGVSAEPVTAHEIMTLRCIMPPLTRSAKPPGLVKCRPRINTLLVHDSLTFRKNEPPDKPVQL